MAEQRVWIEKRVSGLGSSLERLGHLAFWLQVVALVAVVILGGYAFIQTGGDRASTTNVLAFVAMLLPAFTTYWVYRYTLTGREIRLGGSRPSVAGLTRQLWIGIGAGMAGTVAALISLFGAASSLLFTMLANPQIGIQLAAAPGTPAAYTVSAFDAVSIVALLFMLTAELVVIFVSMRLLFQTERASNEVGSK